MINATKVEHTVKWFKDAGLLPFDNNDILKTERWTL